MALVGQGQLIVAPLLEDTLLFLRSHHTLMTALGAGKAGAQLAVLDPSCRLFMPGPAQDV